MNCKEFKIWTSTVSDPEILSPDSEIQEHVEGCNGCRLKLQVLQQSLSYMHRQKELSLSGLQSRELINNLVGQSSQINTKAFSINKLAIAAVLVLGLIAGAIAGEIISSKNNSASSWSSEFTLLSDNTDSNSFVFD